MGSAVLGRGESGSALPGPRHGPQTEAKPWKQDHVTRALVFDKCSLNKLENKCFLKKNEMETARGTVKFKRSKVLSRLSSTPITVLESHRG